MLPCTAVSITVARLISSSSSSFHLSAKKQSELCHFFFPFSALLAMMRDQVTTFSSALQQRLTEVRVVALLLLLPLPNTSI